MGGKALDDAGLVVEKGFFGADIGGNTALLDVVFFSCTSLSSFLVTVPNSLGAVADIEGDTAEEEEVSLVEKGFLVAAESVRGINSEDLLLAGCRELFG